jgi:hypothetical protein
MAGVLRTLMKAKPWQIGLRHDGGIFDLALGTWS